MDSELLLSLRDYLAAKPGAKLLGQEKSERLRTLVANHFDFPESHIWWWETVSQKASFIQYEKAEEGLELLLELIPDRMRQLLLFVTDDTPPPWPCVCGTAPELIDMLREQRFFEYFIVDPELRWIVFDTHHNSLIMVGEGFSTRPIVSPD